MQIKVSICRSLRIDYCTERDNTQTRYTIRRGVGRVYTIEYRRTISLGKDIDYDGYRHCATTRLLDECRIRICSYRIELTGLYRIADRITSIIIPSNGCCCRLYDR